VRVPSRHPWTVAGARAEKKRGFPLVRQAARTPRGLLLIRTPLLLALFAPACCAWPAIGAALPVTALFRWWLCAERHGRRRAADRNAANCNTRAGRVDDAAGEPRNRRRVQDRREWPRPLCEGHRERHRMRGSRNAGERHSRRRGRGGGCCCGAVRTSASAASESSSSSAAPSVGSKPPPPSPSPLPSPSPASASAPASGDVAGTAGAGGAAAAGGAGGAVVLCGACRRRRRHRRRRRRAAADVARPPPPRRHRRRVAATWRNRRARAFDVVIARDCARARACTRVEQPLPTRTAHRAPTGAGAVAGAADIAPPPSRRHRRSRRATAAAPRARARVISSSAMMRRATNRARRATDQPTPRAAHRTPRTATGAGAVAGAADVAPPTSRRRRRHHRAAVTAPRERARVTSRARDDDASRTSASCE